MLAELAAKVDQLIVGGGIANTFMLAAGMRIGKSLSEPDLVPEANRVMQRVRAKGGDVPLPVDVVCAKELSASAVAADQRRWRSGLDDLILDVGPKTSAQLTASAEQGRHYHLERSAGRVRAREFAGGTRAIAQAIASSSAFSLAGGGETVAALGKFGVTERIGYVSTAGGAFLEFLEGRKLPAVEILEQRAAGKTF